MFKFCLEVVFASPAFLTGMKQQVCSYMQVGFLQKDCSRLSIENNHLHLQLIKETEHSDKREREHYQQLKVVVHPFQSRGSQAINATLLTSS